MSTVKHWTWHISMLWVGCVLSGVAVAEEARPTAPPAAPAQPAAAAAEPAKSSKEQQQDAVRAALDGTSWTMELRSDATGKTRQDTLRFSGRTVGSDWMTKTGYGTSNYSMRVEDDGLVIWETMQSKEGEGLAFWRGELGSASGMTMSGTLSRQPTQGDTESFSFSATKLAAVQPVPPAQPAPAAVTPDQPVAPQAPAVVEPAATTPKKKKRGWF